MKIIHADSERREIIPMEGDTLYTEEAVKTIVEHVAMAVKNGNYKKKDPKEWL